MSTLIVIPVRSGSVGIPGKALRSLGGVSPLLRTIATAKQLDADVVVSTNDEAVYQEAAKAGVQAVMQPANVSDANVPLDAPVSWAVDYMERLRYPHKYAIVVTLQCTSPFTTVDTIQKCMNIVQAPDGRQFFTTAITVRDDRGLRWESADISRAQLSARAPRRTTRQNMPPCWRETGAVVATPRQCVEPTSRLAHIVQLVEVSGKEAVDLDTPEDWAIAEMYAGATERELLLARVLCDARRPGEAVILSAWDEGPEEQGQRALMAANYADATVMRGRHTHDEAVLAIEKRTGDDLTIVTSAYHMPRAFLTFLQVLKDHRLDTMVRLWCAPAPSGMAKLSGEWEKVRDYHAKGHVARVDEGLAYLQWRDTLSWAKAYACVA